MKKELRRDPNNKIIAGVCSGIAKYLDIDPVIIRSFGLQRFSYSEQAFFSTSSAGLLSQKKASGKLSLNIQKRDTDLNFLLFRSVSLSFLFSQAENKIADINKE